MTRTDPRNSVSALVEAEQLRDLYRRRRLARTQTPAPAPTTKSMPADTVPVPVVVLERLILAMEQAARAIATPTSPDVPVVRALLGTRKVEIERDRDGRPRGMTITDEASR